MPVFLMPGQEAQGPEVAGARAVNSNRKVSTGALAKSFSATGL
jgi:hypothetical protein